MKSQHLAREGADSRQKVSIGPYDRACITEVGQVPAVDLLYDMPERYVVNGERPILKVLASCPVELYSGTIDQDLAGIQSNAVEDPARVPRIEIDGPSIIRYRAAPSRRKIKRIGVDRTPAKLGVDEGGMHAPALKLHDLERRAACHLRKVVEILERVVGEQDSHVILPILDRRQRKGQRF